MMLIVHTLLWYKPETNDRGNDLTHSKTRDKMSPWSQKITFPRQVGKSLLAKNWLKRKGCASLYFNWDEPSIRRAYFANSRFFESPARSLRIRDLWIVLDEIHKRNRWRDILKGVYDSLINPDQIKGVLHCPEFSA
jgi:predicted AAA+ superfamily ATPase